MNALEQLEGEDAGPRVVPEHARHANMRVAGEVPVELLRVARLHAVVELLPDRSRELVDERDRVDELEGLDPLADEAGHLVHELEVSLDLAGSVRSLDLHG